ncbi:MAG: recombinase zinc beta ribbon domain-containing protein [Clostridia bacterium]
MRYIAGTTVQGKRRTKSYKLHKVETVPKEEWVRVENTHIPIIDKETFKKAQELNKRDTKVSQKTKELSIWAGFLRCSDCKRAMNKKSSTNKSGSIYEYYICSTYRKKSNNLCTKHTLKVEELENAVLQTINLHIHLLIDTEKLLKQINNIEKNDICPNKINEIIEQKQNEISKISNFKRTLYEDWKSEYITKEDYLNYKQKYEQDINKIKEIIINLDKQKENQKQITNTNNEWIESFKVHKNITKLDRGIIAELIDYIEVYEEKKIAIYFKFNNKLESALMQYT